MSRENVLLRYSFIEEKYWNLATPKSESMPDWFLNTPRHFLDFAPDQYATSCINCNVQRGGAGTKVILAYDFFFIITTFYSNYDPQKSMTPEIALATYKQEAHKAPYRTRKYNVPTFWQIGKGGNFYSFIGLKNTNLVEDIEILLPVKFRWNPSSGFRGEVENVWANQMQGQPSCFSNRSEKHKLGRGR